MPVPPSHPSSPTFALGHRGGAIEVGGGVAGTGDAVILPKIGLVGAHGAADAAMDTGVVVMPGGALDWGQSKGAASAAGTAPGGPSLGQDVPLVSQSWKDTAPSRRVLRPPPHGKQSARPTSGW